MQLSVKHAGRFMVWEIKVKISDEHQSTSTFSLSKVNMHTKQKKENQNECKNDKKMKYGRNGMQK